MLLFQILFKPKLPRLSAETKHFSSIDGYFTFFRHYATYRCKNIFENIPQFSALGFSVEETHNIVPKNSKVCTSELTRVLKTAYRVFRILSHKASVSCTKKHRVRYRVSTVKIQIYENSFRKRILTVFSKLVEVCFVCHLKLRKENILSTETELT